MAASPRASTRKDRRRHASCPLPRTWREMLGGTATPSVLFTAGHGLGCRSGTRTSSSARARWSARSGPGRTVERRYPPSSTWRPTMYPTMRRFTGSSRSTSPVLAGTPEFEDFADRTRTTTRGRLAAAPMISALPRRLLAHPGGGALAIAGHVDRAWRTPSHGPRRSPDGGLAQLHRAAASRLSDRRRLRLRQPAVRRAVVGPVPGAGGGEARTAARPRRALHPVGREERRSRLRRPRRP